MEDLNDNTGMGGEGKRKARVKGKEGGEGLQENYGDDLRDDTELQEEKTEKKGKIKKDGKEAGGR